MNIFENVFNEEMNFFLNEIKIGNVPTYPYEQVSSDKFIVKVDDEEKNVHTRFEVYLHPLHRENEKVYSISFKQAGRDYTEKTGMGIQFRLLGTISKIVEKFVETNQVDVFTFSPVKEADKKGNRRLKLYMNFISAGAGENYDAFVIGDPDTHQTISVNVESRNPSFGLENGLIDAEIIQDIMTQFSVYKGYYETDTLETNDPDYAKFGQAGYSFYMQTPEGTKSTASARRLVDWMADYPDLNYIQGQFEPNRLDVPQTDRVSTSRRTQTQRTSTPTPTPQQADVGTFQHFLQTEVYGLPEYEPLTPYFERIKSPEDFEELQTIARQNMTTARNPDDRARLQDVANSIDKLMSAFEHYNTRYGSATNETLNEIEKNLKDLLK
jgi:hypothetical protein